MDVLHLVTDGDLPPVRVEEQPTVDAVLVSILELQDQLARILAAPRTSTRDLEQLVADLTGLMGRVRDLRERLDVWRGVDALPVTSADDLLAGWRWERRVRDALSELTGAILSAQDAAREASRGREVRQALVRSGDTWQSLAQRHLGSWERWRELVEINRADPAAPLTGQAIQLPER